METSAHGAARRRILSLAAAAALSGCVYAPPYGYYDPAGPAPAAAPYSSYPYYGYGYPTYVGPPLSLSFGFYEHSYHGGHGWGGGHGGYHGGHWGGHGGYRGGWHGRH
jgi:hypothetical protein